MKEWPRDMPLIFSGHCLRQMFARRISVDEVRVVVREGVAVSDYPDDKPMPSRLLLGFIAERPLHVVLAYDHVQQVGIVVTAYEPSPEIWNSDYMTRRTP